ncbi:SIS domain-containing protein [Pseudoroseicyclus aestuarii]|uniref:Glucosamine--fructose-6-phosphate aminotransferase (Isomerizing) n=1 Tax=Pseudoroseicyclus aestuarii TaxID=1795041 RepID=A0A318T024_9RHOB|nr:SIS domain-containing protein [Pseudoroseicyclus aestuarii]PYE82437.1 glucosamine--fructose-6-phosphate aminotransferase (isomerizing) [Pseudoroseicyclus aestuarii]
MTSTTETVIRAQFDYLRAALEIEVPDLARVGAPLVFVGCGTSYYLAQALAASANLSGLAALAVPGAEWLNRPGAYLPQEAGAAVIGLSRSGTTTETVAALRASRGRGLTTVAISCEEDSPILEAAEHRLYLPTDSREGIVMSTSASLMLLGGLRMIGVTLTMDDIAEAEALMQALDAEPGLIEGCTHHVFLGAGPLYGIACEGALKLMEMSINPAQAFHPMEFRHGPISLTDERTLAVMLYAAEGGAEQAALAAELEAKGARVLGLGGPGTLALGTAPEGDLRQGLRVLPALQLLGEKVALLKGIDTETPRHLTKVVLLEG